jgi:hypothetical protein
MNEKNELQPFEVKVKELVKPKLIEEVYSGAKLVESLCRTKCVQDVSEDGTISEEDLIF